MLKKADATTTKLGCNFSQIKRLRSEVTHGKKRIHKLEHDKENKEYLNDPAYLKYLEGGVFVCLTF